MFNHLDVIKEEDPLILTLRQYYFSLLLFAAYCIDCKVPPVRVSTYCTAP